MVIHQAKSCDFVKLVCPFLFASSQYMSTLFFCACPSMSAGPRYCFCVRFLTPWQFFICCCRNSWLSTFLCIGRQHSRSICIHVKCIPSIRGQEMVFVLQDPQVSSISSTYGSDFAFFQPFWCHPRLPIRTILVFDEQTDIPSSVFFPSKSN